MCIRDRPAQVEVADGLGSVYPVSYTHLDVYKRQSEDNTSAKFFRLFNGPYKLRERVGRNTFIVIDEDHNKIIEKYHGASLRKYYPRERSNP